MMSKKLEQMVERRTKQAIKKNFIEKANVIAQEFKDARKDNRYISFGYECKRGDLELALSCIGNRAGLPGDESCLYFSLINYKGQKVFSASYEEFYTEPEIYTYIPGQWEEKFEKLYLSALNKKERRAGDSKKARDLKKESKIKKDFGL